MEIIKFKTTRDYKQQVVGESNYQDALEQIAEDYENRFVDCVELILEDENKYDSNAVAVTVDNETVGYLSRDDAITYRQCLEDLGYFDIVGVCSGKLIGGGPGRSYGFVLDLDLDNLEVIDSYTPRSQSKPKPAQSKTGGGCLGCIALPFRAIAWPFSPERRKLTLIILGAFILFCCLCTVTVTVMDSLGLIPTSTPTAPVY